jgi:hypothetical protein
MASASSPRSPMSNSCSPPCVAGAGADPVGKAGLGRAPDHVRGSPPPRGAAHFPLRHP